MSAAAEGSYLAAAAERERIATQVVLEHRHSLNAYVRKVVPARCQEDAKQAALVGLLVALEKYAPSAGAFDPMPYVRDEVRKWMETSVYWRKAGAR